MPQPLTTRQSEGTYWNVDTLAERPECALGVAKVASAWAFLEFELAHMFMQATGDFEFEGDGNAELVGQPLAVAALSPLESLTAKLDVISAGLEAYLPALNERFEQLRTGIRACARERNRVVHAVWGANDRYPRAIIRVMTFSDEFIKYTVRDFDEITERIVAQLNRVREFDQTCRAEREREL